MYAVNIPIFINILAKKMPLVNRQRAYNIWISVINILHKKHKSEARSASDEPKARAKRGLGATRRRPADRQGIDEEHTPDEGQSSRGGCEELARQATSRMPRANQSCTAASHSSRKTEDERGASAGRRYLSGRYKIRPVFEDLPNGQTGAPTGGSAPPTATARQHPKSPPLAKPCT